MSAAAVPGALVAALSGTFCVDMGKSDSLEPLMIAIGISWLARKAALAMGPGEQVLSLSAGGFSVRNASENAYVFDGPSHHKLASGETYPASLSLAPGGSGLNLNVEMADKGYDMKTVYAPSDHSPGGVLISIAMHKIGSAVAETVIKRFLDRK